MSRPIWFAAGAGAGVWAMVRGRRVAESLTVDGLRDRWSGLALGARMLRDEVAQGSAEKETELRERLEWTLDGPRVRGELERGGVDTLARQTSPTESDRPTHPIEEYR